MPSRNEEFTAQVEAGKWPKAVLVPLDNNFEDARGVIQNLVLAPMSSAAIITSKKGTIRANHYHKTDWHYAYVISGAIDYYHRPAGSTASPEKLTIRAGQMFFTPPLVEHTMVFPEDTVFLTLAKNVRTHDNHESDLVRVKLVDNP